MYCCLLLFASPPHPVLHFPFWYLLVDSFFTIKSCHSFSKLASMDPLLVVLFITIILHLVFFLLSVIVQLTKVYSTFFVQPFGGEQVMRSKVCCCAKTLVVAITKKSNTIIFIEFILQLNLFIILGAQSDSPPDHTSMRY